MKFSPLHAVCSQSRTQVRPGARCDLKYIGLESIEPGTGRFAKGALSKTPDAPRAVSFHFDTRHVLYGKLRPYLNKVVAPEIEGKCSTELIPLLPNEELDRHYLAFFLRTHGTVRAITGRTAGARMPRADMDFLLSLEIPLPDIYEQKRIVELLSLADGIVRLRREAHKTASQLVPALFFKAFGNPGTYSKHWPVSSLGEIIADGPQNGLYKQASFYGDGTPILRIDSFYDGIVSNPASLKRVRLGAFEVDRFALNEGDIVINRVNSPEYLGKSALIPHLAEPTVFESNMMRLAVDGSRVLPGYLIAFLQTSFARNQLLARAKHAINQSSINQEDVKALLLPIPSISEQESFLCSAAAVSSITIQQNFALNVSQSTFDALLHQSFVP